MNTRQGFTVIEILVSLGILSVVSAGVAATLLHQKNEAVSLEFRSEGERIESNLAQVIAQPGACAAMMNELKLPQDFWIPGQIHALQEGQGFRYLSIHLPKVESSPSLAGSYFPKIAITLLERSGASALLELELTKAIRLGRDPASVGVRRVSRLLLSAAIDETDPLSPRLASCSLDGSAQGMACEDVGGIRSGENCYFQKFGVASDFVSVQKGLQAVGSGSFYSQGGLTSDGQVLVRISNQVSGLRVDKESGAGWAAQFNSGADAGSPGRGAMLGFFRAHGGIPTGGVDTAQPVRAGAVLGGLSFEGYGRDSHSSRPSDRNYSAGQILSIAESDFDRPEDAKSRIAFFNQGIEALDAPSVQTMMPSAILDSSGVLKVSGAIELGAIDPTHNVASPSVRISAENGSIRAQSLDLQGVLSFQGVRPRNGDQLTVVDGRTQWVSMPRIYSGTAAHNDPLTLPSGNSTQNCSFHVSPESLGALNSSEPIVYVRARVAGSLGAPRMQCQYQRTSSGALLPCEASWTALCQNQVQTGNGAVL